MDNLRHPSSRPSIVVDDAADRIADPSSSTTVGRPGPFGRERVVFALPLDPGPALLSPAELIRDASVANLADPARVLLGVPAVWVSRMLTASATNDTRRL